MNTYRHDVGDFQIFFDVFSGNSGSKFTHHHDSLLSYAIYYRGEEILVDPGRSSFVLPSDYHFNYRHNGLWSSNSKLRPIPRFFMPPVFLKDAIDIKISNNPSVFDITAENLITGFKKSIRIQQSCEKVIFSEMLESNKKLGVIGFTHCFSGLDLFPSNEFIYKFKNLIIEYGQAMKDSLVDRAISYGEVERVTSLSFHAEYIGKKVSTQWGIRNDN